MQWVSISLPPSVRPSVSQTQTFRRKMCYRLYDDVYHTPLGRFSQLDLLDNQEGANQHRTTPLRKAPGETLPTSSPFFAPALLQPWRHRPRWKIGPCGCDVYRPIRYCVPVAPRIHYSLVVDYRIQRCMSHPPWVMFHHGRYCPQKGWNCDGGVENVGVGKTYRREFSGEVSFGAGTLFVVEQSSLENRPGGVWYTPSYLVGGSYYRTCRLFGRFMFT